MDELRKAPGLGAVLRALRERAGLSRPQVIAALSETKRNRSGDPTAEYSSDWYARIETRERSHPSEADLDDILQIIGSDRLQLQAELGIETELSPLTSETADLDKWSHSTLRSAAPAPMYRNQDSFRSSAFGSDGRSDLGFEHSSSRHQLMATEQRYDEPASLLGSVAPASDPSVCLSTEEQQLLDTFRELSSENRSRAIAHTRSLLGRQR